MENAKRRLKHKMIRANTHPIGSPRKNNKNERKAVFKKTKTDCFPKLMKDKSPQIQQHKGAPSKKNKNKNSYQDTIH